MIIKPPTPIPVPKTKKDGKLVFLAGSIEMGKAVDWQKDAERALNACGWTVLNPRRDDWDSSWVQSIDNPQFREQVEWELGGLEHAHAILFYFAPGTMSPISLLEFGMWSKSGKVFVVCPDEFWRSGNVHIVSEYYRCPRFATIEEALGAIMERP